MTDERMAELLDRYLIELEANPAAPPPPGLDPQLVETWRKMSRHLADPQALDSASTAEFNAELRARLDRRAAGLARTRTTPTTGARTSPPARRSSFSRWSFAGVAVALVIALVGLAILATRPPGVSAQELLGKARSAASDLASVGVTSFEMTQTSFAMVVDDPNTPPVRTTRGETKTWYAGPSRWRIESHSETTNQPPLETITVSDGEAQWDYDVAENTVNINAADPHSFPSPILSLDLLQQDMSNCYDPRVVGEEPIAGRPAYKVELGPARCRSASAPDLNGPHTLWIDQETFFVLKSEIRAVNGDRVTTSLEVTAVRYNIDLPADRFTFVPPPDARINDARPKPAPGAAEYASQLADLAARAPFPVFAPTSLPDGFVPRAPVYNEIEQQVELAFVPREDVSNNPPAELKGILIVEKLASYELVRNRTGGAEPFDLDGIQAWVRRGNFDQTTGGSNSAVLLVRDGTLVSVSSFTIGAEQLTATARSLRGVPGGHAPLPNPTAPTLAEIRATADYPFSVPTYLPEGLTPAPPTSHQVEYYRADGSLALIVQNSRQGEGGMEQEPRFKGETIKLSNGQEIHELGFDPGIMILWWNRDGGYVALEGHGLPRDEMLKIAASMSSTAELGDTREPPAPPTPTPVPGPSFTILKPSWLPEELTVTETNVPGPQSTTGVEIHFDPRPGTSPHDVLTLIEMPGRGEEIIDPQAVKKEIGGRTVTIVMRGDACISYWWTQGEVSLTLTNAYDPPGQPRYSCDQMDRIVESIR